MGRAGMGSETLISMGEQQTIEALGTFQFECGHEAAPAVTANRGY